MAGKFYTLTTGANERRWGKMKDKLQTIIDSFEIFNVWCGCSVFTFPAREQPSLKSCDLRGTFLITMYSSPFPFSLSIFCCRGTEIRNYIVLDMKINFPSNSMSWKYYRCKYCSLRFNDVNRNEKHCFLELQPRLSIGIQNNHKKRARIFLQTQRLDSFREGKNMITTAMVQ